MTEYDMSQISEPDYPPTLEASIDVLTAIGANATSLVDLIETFATLHFSQAIVIRGERGRAERAEAELAARELHHFETEQLLARLVAARSNHPEIPECDKYSGDDVITCGWKRAVEDIDKVLKEIPNE